MTTRPPETAPAEAPRFERGRAVLTVDLDAVRANYARLRQEAAPSAVAAVVKADGYGLGASAVAPALWEAGCHIFFVAHLDEALTLRALLPEAAIGVLNGLTASDPAAFVAHDLVPVLNHPGELASWIELARRRGERLPAVLHIDTGLCRLGFDAADVDRIDREDLAAIELRLLMSHLACADEPDHPLNRRQIERFEVLRRHLPPARASLANSSGIFLGPEARFDLCRPGVALYGVNPMPGRRNPMRPVVSLHAPLLQVHEVAEPGGVGYGATYPIRPGSRVATVALGYADGLLRSAGNHAVARIGAWEVLVAGRVSMDLIALDVTGLPEGAVHPGAAVELVGGPDGVDALAAACGTIGYEVLTRLGGGGRFERRYLGGADGGALGGAEAAA